MVFRIFFGNKTAAAVANGIDAILVWTTRFARSSTTPPPKPPSIRRRPSPTRSRPAMPTGSSQSLLKRLPALQPAPRPRRLSARPCSTPPAWRQAPALSRLSVRRSCTRLAWRQAPARAWRSARPGRRGRHSGRLQRGHVCQHCDRHRGRDSGYLQRGHGCGATGADAGVGIAAGASTVTAAGRVITDSTFDRIVRVPAEFRSALTIAEVRVNGSCQGVRGGRLRAARGVRLGRTACGGRSGGNEGGLRARCTCRAAGRRFAGGVALWRSVV